MSRSRDLHPKGGELNDSESTVMHPNRCVPVGYAQKHESRFINWGHGWSHAEIDHRWTIGYEATLGFSVALSNDNNKRNIRLRFHTLGKQKISIFINDIFLYQDVVDSSDHEVFLNNIIFFKKENCLTFKLPDAKTPGGGDNRILAIAFREFELLDIDNHTICDDIFYPQTTESNIYDLPKISLMFIVKDEYDLALKMLSSVSKMVSYVSFVDTNSTNNTKTIIENYLKEIEMPFSSKEVAFTNFSNVRNFALEMIPHYMDYILVLDADETLDYCDSVNFKTLLFSNLECDGFYLPRRNLTQSGELIDYPDLQLRVFKNIGFHYEGNVHEKPRLPYKPIIFKPIPGELSKVPHINHYKYFKDPDQLTSRHQAYLSFYKENCQKNKKLLLSKLNLNEDLFSFHDNTSVPTNIEYNPTVSLRNLVIKLRPNIIISVGNGDISELVCIAYALFDSGHDGTILATNWWFRSRVIDDKILGVLRNETALSLSDVDAHKCIIPVGESDFDLRNILADKNIEVDLIHFNKDLDYKELCSQLEMWWPFLKNGGCFFGGFVSHGSKTPDIDSPYKKYFGDRLNLVDNSCFVFKDA